MRCISSITLTDEQTERLAFKRCDIVQLCVNDTCVSFSFDDMHQVAFGDNNCVTFQHAVVVDVTLKAFEQPEREDKRQKQYQYQVVYEIYYLGPNDGTFIKGACKFKTSLLSILLYEKLNLIFLHHSHNSERRKKHFDWRRLCHW